MDTTVLDRLREQRDEARDAAIALAESDTFDPESESFREVEARAASLDTQVERLADLLGRRQAANAIDGRMAAAARKAVPLSPEVRQSLGAQFTSSEVFTGYPGRGTSSRLEVEMPEVRALPTGIADMVAAGLKGVVHQVDVTAPLPPTPLMDNVTQVPVSGNAIEYVLWAKKAGGAAKVAEKAAKPSAEFGPTVTSATLDTFAVYTQLTRQLIEDAPAVRSIIDNGLRADVAKAVETDAAAVLAAASATIPDVSNTDLMAAIRQGVGTVQGNGFQPNAVMLNPADWAALDIATMAKTPGSPTSSANFWGLSVISAPSLAAGKAIVGDFRTGMHHYYRSQIALYVTDSHGDTFLSNVFTLLAEQRGKTVVVRPFAFAECNKTP